MNSEKKNKILFSQICYSPGLFSIFLLIYRGDQFWSILHTLKTSIFSASLTEYIQGFTCCKTFCMEGMIKNIHVIFCLQLLEKEDSCKQWFSETLLNDILEIQKQFLHFWNMDLASILLSLFDSLMPDITVNWTIFSTISWIKMHCLTH